MEGDKLELYKLICLIAASIVVLFIVLFIIRDLFTDMRNRNISQISKMGQKSSREARQRQIEKTKKKKSFKVYKGNNRKRTDGRRERDHLTKIK